MRVKLRRILFFTLKKIGKILVPCPPPIVLGLIVIFTFASAFPYIQLAERAGVSPLPLGSLRCFIAFLCLSPILLLPSKNVPRPDLKDLGRIFLCGAVGFFAYFYFLNVGELTVPSSVAGLVLASTPIFAAIIATIIAGERLSLFGWLGSAVAFGGVAVVALAGGKHLSGDKGILLLVIGAVLNGLFAVIQRPVVRKFGALRSICYILGAGALCLSPWLPQGLHEVTQSPQALKNVLILVLFPTLIGYGMWGAVVHEVGAAKAGIFLYALPPVALLLSWYLLGQKPSVTILFGGAIILGGVILTKIHHRHFTPSYWRSLFYTWTHGKQDPLL